MSTTTETLPQGIRSGAVLLPFRLDPEAIRRVGLADLDVMREWLIKRMQERYTDATAPQIMGFLRGCVNSNEYWFVQTDHACALAQITRRALERQPVAVEIFVFRREEEDEEEAAELYPRMCSWAANLDASRLEVDNFSDVTRGKIKGRCGHVYSKSAAHIKLGSLG